MPRYKMLTMSRPTEGREDEYNDWYQNVHLQEIVALDGFRTARRYRLAKEMREEGIYPYVAVYEVDAPDADAAVTELTTAAREGRINMSEAIDRGDIYAAVYEAFGDVVNES